MKSTPAVEDYLKSIYKLQQTAETVTTTDIAKGMKVSMASTSNMVKRLTKEGMVSHKPYKGVQLTPKGEKFILKLVRRHRLLELFLTKILRMDWDMVDAEAEQLEHVISDDLEQRIDDLLGHPKTDPHGDPIPKSDGTLNYALPENLLKLKPGQAGRISRVSDSNPEILRYLNQLGMIPKADIEVIRRDPFNGPILIKVGRKQHHIGLEVANSVYVEEIKDKVSVK